MEDYVNELKDTQLGLKTTMAKMLHSEMVDVTSFAWFHFGEENLVKL